MSSSDESNTRRTDGRTATIALVVAIALGFMSPPPATAACDNDCLKAAVDELIAGVTSFTTGVSGLATQVTSLQTSVTTSVEGADKVLAQFAGAVSKFPPPALDVSTSAAHAIQRGFEASKYLLESEKAQYDRFVGASGCSADVCVPFRTALAEMVLQTAELHNAGAGAFADHLGRMAGVEFNLLLLIDISRIEELAGAILSQVPGQVFFPIYKALTVATVVSSGDAGMGLVPIEDPAIRILVTLNGVLARMLEILAQTGAVGPSGNALLWGASSAGDTWIDALLAQDQCWFYSGSISDPSPPKIFGAAFTLFGEILKIVGKMMAAEGHEVVEGVKLGVEFAVSAATAVDIRDHQVWGHVLLGLSQFFRAFGDSFTYGITTCQARMTQQVLLCVQRWRGNTQVSDVAARCKTAVLMAYQGVFVIDGKEYDHLGF